MRRPTFQAVGKGKPGGLNDQNGAKKLLKRLQNKLSRPKVPDVAADLEDFSLRRRRRKGEAARTRAVCSQECYQRLRRALAEPLNLSGLTSDQLGNGSDAWASVQAPMSGDYYREPDTVTRSFQAKDRPFKESDAGSPFRKDFGSGDFYGGNHITGTRMCSSEICVPTTAQDSCPRVLSRQDSSPTKCEAEPSRRLRRRRSPTTGDSGQGRTNGLPQPGVGQDIRAGQG